MPKVRLSTYVDHLDQYFTFDEVRELAIHLGVDFENFNYSTKKVGIRELVAYLNRRNRLDELENEMLKINPNSRTSFILNKAFDLSSKDVGNASDEGAINVGERGVLVDGDIRGDIITGTQVELYSARQQIEEVKELLIRQDRAADEQITKLLEEMNKTIKIALGRTEELKADLIPPSTEDRQIKLIPEHHINRLEEYRSDENIVYLLIGLFAGAAIGIIVNWATNDNFNPNPVSLTFLGLFIALTLASIVWAYRINKRTKIIIDRIFPERKTRELK